MFFPKLEVEGTYEVNGQVLLLPIRGTGPFKGNFSKFTQIQQEQMKSI